MSAGRVALLGDGKCPSTICNLDNTNSTFHHSRPLHDVFLRSGNTTPQFIHRSDLTSDQGACQAIEDATELGNLLQRYFSVPAEKRLSNVDDVLKEYSTRREARAKDIVAFSSNYAKVHMGKLPYGMGPLIRKLVYAYAPAWSWMWYLGWLYGYQPTVDAVR